MKRSIYWLHISDLHLRVGHEWSQNFVLKEMCRNIGQKRNSGIMADFILLTGDIAFSGKAEEYDLAKEFFDQLQTSSGVPRDRMFCVPGNHDIDRYKQKNAFDGARQTLRSRSDVDKLLGDRDELEVLLQRQEHYREFQESYFSNQPRTWTSDGLAYVSHISVDGVVFAIIGLNSAWLAEGGESDHGRLLIGERQAFDALNAALDVGEPPHVVIAMAHHPFRLLQEFDRLPIQHRLERDVHFFHHGHLHQPESRMGGPSGSQCLTVAAGATYAGREYENSYSFVTLDPWESTRILRSHQFNHTLGTYSMLSEDEQYPIDFIPRAVCDVPGLAQAMTSYSPTLEPFAYYISALILGYKSEFPIEVPEGHTFGSVEALSTVSAGELTAKSAGLVSFRNILHIHCGRKVLEEILETYGSIILEYEKVLNLACERDPELRMRLTERNQDARRLAGNQPSLRSSYTLSLLEDLKESRNWNELLGQSSRHMYSPNPSVAIPAKRMFALALASIGDLESKKQAIEVYYSLITSETREVLDFANLALVLKDVGAIDEAVSVIFEGFNVFPERGRMFYGIGNQIVAATGDRELRARLEEMIRG